VNFVQTDFI